MVQLGHVVDRPRQLGAGDVLVGGVGGRLVRAGLRLWRISGRTVGLLVRGWRPSSCSQGRTSWSPPLRSTARLAAAMPATTRAEGAPTPPGSMRSSGRSSSFACRRPAGAPDAGADQRQAHWIHTEIGEGGRGTAGTGRVRHVPEDQRRGVRVVAGGGQDAAGGRVGHRGHRLAVQRPPLHNRRYRATGSGRDCRRAGARALRWRRRRCG